MDSKIIGNKIAEARKKLNISQAQLAESLFFSAQAVGKWERGESMPDITTFNRLAIILGVDLNYFSDDFKPLENNVKSSESLDNPSTETLSGEKNKMSGWDMSRGNWVDADFSGLQNLHEKFSSSNMQRCRFNGSDLSGLLLKTNNVDSCDFSGSDMSNCFVQGSNILNNVFRDCSLKETKFSGSNIDKCNFSGASLAGTEFLRSYINSCDLKGTDFTRVSFKSGGFTGVKVKSGDLEINPVENAVWNHTSFIDTHIADIVFASTLKDCYFENCSFTRVTFQNATLINTFFKNNKNVKRIRFIDCKADRITYEFLKQGKAVLAGVTLITEKGENRL